MTVELPTGAKMPIVGMGTWQATDETDIASALDCGYKLIDTAFCYGSEAAIGKALKARFKSGKLKRKDTFIISKLWTIHMSSRQEVMRACKLSLESLQLDYLDLYLIHQPFGMKFIDDSTIVPQDKTGKILMANYELEEVWKLCWRYVQINAYLQQRPLHEFCKQRNISLTAYGPIGSPGRPDFSNGTWITGGPRLLDDPIIKLLAEKYQKTTAQILLRSLIQRGMAVVPKSSNPERLKENLQVFDFELDEQDMQQIVKLDKGFKYFPGEIFSDHPEYAYHEPY